jgi:hypothetical protein
MIRDPTFGGPDDIENAAPTRPTAFPARVSSLAWTSASRIDGIADGGAPGSEADGCETDLEGIYARDEAAPRGGHLGHDRSGREDVRAFGHRGIAALRRDELGEALERLPIVEQPCGELERPCLVGLDATQGDHPRGQDEAHFAHVRRTLAPQHVHGFPNLERVPHREPERALHPCQDRRGRKPQSPRDGDEPLCQIRGGLHVRHERAASHLDVEHECVQACGQLLREDASGDEGWTFDRRRHVAEGVHASVGGRHLRGLPDDRHTDLGHQSLDLAGREIGRQAGNRFELVERPASVAEPSPGDHRDAKSRRGGYGRHDERQLVAHSPRRVLVHFGAAGIAEVENGAGSEHDARQGLRLGVGHAPEEHSHEEGGHLVVEHAPVEKTADHVFDLGGLEFLTPALAQDDLVGGHASPPLLTGEPASAAGSDPLEYTGSSAAVSPRLCERWRSHLFGWPRPRPSPSRSPGRGSRPPP